MVSLKRQTNGNRVECSLPGGKKRRKWGDVRKGYNLPVIREISSENLIFSISIVNNTILYLRKLLRVEFKCCHNINTYKL